MYYSVPPWADGRPNDGWAIGIAESRDLKTWKRVGEVLPDPSASYERKGICAPYVRVVNGSVHLFYQTYGNGPKDAICHAVSTDGMHFIRDETNPIFHPTGDWNSGRAIDVEIVDFKQQWFLYAATSDSDLVPLDDADWLARRRTLHPSSRPGETVAPRHRRNCHDRRRPIWQFLK